MSKQPSKALVSRHRSVPIPETICAVPNYPPKLVIFKLAASPFYWARSYSNGKIVKRSTKTESKRDAIEFAKGFYDELLLRERNLLPISSRPRFELCVKEMQEIQAARVKRGERSESMYKNEQYRLDKDILPFFRAYDVGEVSYALLEKFVAKLHERDLAPATLKLHISTVSKVLKHAHKRNLIPHLPAFPTIELHDSPRGHFDSPQYQKLLQTTKRLIGTTFQLRAGKDDAARKVTVTHELRDLIMFMTNSFLRPTDIKILKHEHVAIVEGKDRFIRLTHPSTKKHAHPVCTMEAAIEIYRRLLEAQKEKGYGKPSDYLFLPEQLNRDYALTTLRRQFDYVLDEAKLKKSPDGKARTLYSLRHTSIMFRLINGDGIDLLTLARNARTSLEMIDRFYASGLKGEMGIASIQSFRSNGRVAKGKTKSSKAETAEAIESGAKG